MTFDEIMAPLGAEAFTRDYLGQRPLHLQGSASKFAAVMNWERLNDLLGMTTVWSNQTMMLILDNDTVPPASYTSSAVGRDGGAVLQPDPARVQQCLARGATMVLNFIDQLLPELSAFARSLEQALGGTVQGNLYLSSKRKQGFKAHFDFHDVFAMHAMGEKTWFVFQGRADNPIKHPMFEGWPRERHNQLQGELWREVRLRPGDLLYLPRGQYHYALADDGPCVHIAWGVTYPIGMDVVSYAFERMVAESLGRANLPRDRVALQSRLAEIAQIVAQRLAEPQALEDMLRARATFRGQRDRYDLPGLIERADAAFRVKRSGLRLVSQGGRHGLVKEGTRQAVEVPAEIQPQVAWVMGRDGFGKRELAAAFPTESVAKLDRLLGDLHRMALVEPA
jgi:bifunctional lysine-specific demethylase and histidyl-hydroxylase MINA